jgi:cyclopropane fatty-acyl-phospholipid synthase-like methyltransferase
VTQKELKKRYCESLFSRANILSKKEFEAAVLNYEKIYREYLPRNKKAKILDLGCGAGHFLYYLQKKGFKNFIGIDISEQQVAFCKKNISKSVKVFDAFQFLSTKEEFFDLVVANDFLEHIPKERVIELLQLVYGSLKKGGKFVIKTPNMSNPFSLDSRYKDLTHEIGFTEISLYQVLSVANFESIQIYPFKTGFSLTPKGIVSRVILNFFYYFMKKLFALQGYVVPNILSKLLIAVAKKNEKDCPNS